MTDQPNARSGADGEEVTEGRSRRRLILAGAAGIAAAAVLGESRPVAAGPGTGFQGALELGSNSLYRPSIPSSNTPNVSSVATDLVASPNFGNYISAAGYYVFRVDARPAGSTTYAGGVEGYATGGAVGVYGDSAGGYGLLGTGRSGVSGSGTDGDGVFGSSANAYGGSFSGGRAAIRLNPKSGAGAPTTGAHSRGEVVVDNVGVMFLCKTSGTPGTWVQVSEQSAGPGTPAPSFKALPTPDRFVDTRTNLGGTQGPVQAGSTATFQMTGRNGESGNPALQIPATATAIVGNLSVIGSASAPVGSFVTLWPTGDRPTTSSISFGPGAIVANSYTVGLADGKINAFAQQACDYIIDVVGYFG